jgi:hypothetical protein
MAWERIHTVHGYHDGPLEGVADFEGQPHWYSREFAEAADEYSDRYWLTRIEPDLLVLVMEHWEIWLRWRTAFQQGQVILQAEQDPMALPVDRQRALELKLVIDDRIHAKTEKSFLRGGIFDVDGVEWRKIS